MFSAIFRVTAYAETFRVTKIDKNYKRVLFFLSKFGDIKPDLCGVQTFSDRAHEQQIGIPLRPAFELRTTLSIHIQHFLLRQTPVIFTFPYFPATKSLLLITLALW